jgi:DnaK suppressor protein
MPAFLASLRLENQELFRLVFEPFTSVIRKTEPFCTVLVRWLPNFVNPIAGAGAHGYNPGPQDRAVPSPCPLCVSSKGVCMGIQIPADYRPSEGEPFMNERQREYFRRKLNAWKEEILKESRETIQNLQAETVPHADLADRASTEAERQLELRTRDRQRKLIAKIDAALRRIEDGSYGFCEETGEPISLKRLDARPIATLSIEAQERHERREKVYRDD